MIKTIVSVYGRNFGIHRRIPKRRKKEHPKTSYSKLDTDNTGFIIANYCQIDKE